jgi:hypothetical protein
VLPLPAVKATCTDPLLGVRVVTTGAAGTLPSVTEPVALSASIAEAARTTSVPTPGEPAIDV